jgi:hypothetical protein
VAHFTRFAGRVDGRGDRHGAAPRRSAEAASMPGEETTYISIGHRCSSAAVLDRCRLGRESLPFDSIVCQLEVVKDCLENGFDAFLDPGNYVRSTTVTVNLVDDVVEFVGNEAPNVNRHYRDACKRDAGDAFVGSSTYHQRLALTHHDLSLPEHREAFSRRIARLRDLLGQDRRKVYVYIHPIMGSDHFQRERGGMVDRFVDFSEFMRRRSANTFGLFFVPVRSKGDADAGCSTRILGNDLCSAHVIHANRNFIDAGGPFSGDCEREIEAMAGVIAEHRV